MCRLVPSGWWHSAAVDRIGMMMDARMVELHVWSLGALEAFRDSVAFITKGWDCAMVGRSIRGVGYCFNQNRKFIRVLGRVP